MYEPGANRLLVIGGMSRDHITTSAGAVHLDVPGGNAAFAAIGARAWGVSPAIVALVGTDYPEAWLSRLTALGIDTRGIQRFDGAHENHFAVRYINGRDREPFVPLDAFDAARTPVPEPLRRMAALIDSASDNGWTANDETRTATWRADPDLVADDLWESDAVLIVPAALERQRMWVDRCRARMRPDALLLLDPEEEQGRDLTEHDLAPLLATVDCLLPSERQVSAMGRGQEDPSIIARRLSALGPRVVAIKLGAAGCLVYDRAIDREFRIPAVPTSVGDVTGAGDAFCGGFSAGYLATGDAEIAGMLGTVSASFAVEDFGIFAPARHGPEEARRRLDELRASSPKTTTDERRREPT